MVQTTMNSPSVPLLFGSLAMVGFLCYDDLTAFSQMNRTMFRTAGAVLADASGCRFSFLFQKYFVYNIIWNKLLVVGGANGIFSTKNRPPLEDNEPCLPSHIAYSCTNLIKHQAPKKAVSGKKNYCHNSIQASMTTTCGFIL